MTATPPRLAAVMAWRAAGDWSAPIHWPDPDPDTEFLHRHRHDVPALAGYAIRRAGSGAPALLPPRPLPPPVTGDWRPPQPPPAPPGFRRRQP